jgi:hypothetical protein
VNLYLKHNAARKSKITLQTSLEKLGLPYRMHSAGVVEVKVQLSTVQLVQLQLILAKLGLELVDGRSYAG